MSFADTFWTILYTFFLIAYLIVLFQIFADLFRDNELSGGWKAVWTIFLVFLPVVTSLVYLIARGDGMAQRQQNAVLKAKADTDTYIREVASTSPADHIAASKMLLDQGVITQPEFDILKAKALA